MGISRATRGRILTLQQATTLPRPGPTDLDFGGDVSEIQTIDGGPRGGEILISAAAPVGLTDVGMAIVVDGEVNVLATPGAEAIAFPDLAVDEVPVMWPIDWIGRVSRIGVFAGTPGGVLITVRLRLLYDVP